MIHWESMLESITIVLILCCVTTLQKTSGLPSDVHIHMHLEDMDDQIEDDNKAENESPQAQNRTGTIICIQLRARG